MQSATADRSVTPTGAVSYVAPVSRWRRNGVKVNGCYINLEVLFCLAISSLIALIPGIYLAVVGFKVTCFNDGTCHTNPLMILGLIVIVSAILVFIGGLSSYCVLSKKAKLHQAIQQSMSNNGGQSTTTATNPPRGVPVIATTTNYGFDPDSDMDKPSSPPAYKEIVGKY